MEHEFAPAITPREILYHLPELVSGREPILDNPLARRLMLANPECRSALLAISNVTTTYAGRNRVALGLTGPERARFTRVRSATKEHFKHELCALLRESANIKIAEKAERDGGWVERTSQYSKSWQQARIDRHLPRVIAASQLSSDAILHARRTDSAAAFLAAAESMVPGDAWVKYSAVAVEYVSQPRIEISPLVEIAKTSTDLELIASALGLLGRYLLDQSKPGEALEILDRANSIYRLFVSNQLNGLLASALVGNLRRTSHYIDSLSKATNSSFVTQNIIRDLVFGAELWKSACRKDSSLLPRLSSMMRSAGISDGPVLEQRT